MKLQGRKLLQGAGMLCGVLALASCSHGAAGSDTGTQTAAASADATPQADKPKLGEVVFRENGSSLYEGRVLGPHVNITRREDGSWGGVLKDQVFDTNVTPTDMRGANFSMHKEQADDGSVEITGQWQGQNLRFDISDKLIYIRNGQSVSLKLPRTGEDAWGVGQNTLHLRGSAARMPPVWPDLPLALLGAF